MRWLRRLLGLALVVAVMMAGWKLAAANDAIVPVRYLWGVVDAPLWQVLLGSFAAGFALASLGWGFSGLRSGMVQRRYRKAVGKLESEVHELRNLPLAPGIEAEGTEEPADSAPDRAGRGG